MKNTTCVFIGNSECFDMDREMLKAEIIKLIDRGVTRFLCGGLNGFDSVCAKTVRKLKKTYPHVQCILVIVTEPENNQQKFHNGWRGWVEFLLHLKFGHYIPYLTISLAWKKQLYDDVLYPEYQTRDRKKRGTARIRYMMESSAYAICYLGNTWSKAIKPYLYARTYELEIINIKDWHETDM